MGVAVGVQRALPGRPTPDLNVENSFATGDTQRL